jgi:large subunit ribosomal protein L35
VLARSEHQVRSLMVCDRVLQTGVESMPKLKTNRAAAKRFRKTAKGFKRYSSRRRHNLGDKPRKQKRHLRSGGSSLVDVTDVGRVVQLLPNHKVSPRKRATPYVAKSKTQTK